jgi:hypothetical protein
VLSLRWNRAYFTIGLPIFVWRVERAGGLVDLSLEDLARSGATAAGPSLVFHRLGPDAIAFREKPFSGSFLHYTPIMHGVIRHRVEESSVVVMGLANWYAVALVAAFASLLGKSFLDIAPLVAFVFAAIYLIQAVRFTRVAQRGLLSTSSPESISPADTGTRRAP